MVKKTEPCSQCYSVGFHKMSCTEPWGAPKRSQATQVPPTPSKGPQRPSVWFLGGIDEYCGECAGSGEIFFNLGVIIECPFCDGTGWVYLDEEEKK